MSNLLGIFVWGGIGTLVRYWLSLRVARTCAGIFPVGTLMVNLVGSFLIGCLWAFAERVPFAPAVRNMAFVGFLGGFTTFSSFSLETMNLFREGEWRLALVNVALTNIVGIGLVIAGFLLCRACVR